MKTSSVLLDVLVSLTVKNIDDVSSHLFSLALSKFKENVCEDGDRAASK